MEQSGLILSLKLKLYIDTLIVTDEMQTVYLCHLLKYITITNAHLQSTSYSSSCEPVTSKAQMQELMSGLTLSRM